MLRLRTPTAALREISGKKSAFAAPMLEDRLKKSAGNRPDRRALVEDIDVAAEAADGGAERDIRKEKRLRRADVGVRRDQKLFGGLDVGAALEQSRRQA